MSTVPQGRAAAAEVVFPPDGSVGYHFGSLVKTDAYEEWRPIDEQMGYHERIRLLYVACTRAKNHLYVSHPLRYYTQPWGKSDTHGYAQRTRFISPAVLPAFLEQQAVHLSDEAQAHWESVAHALEPVVHRADVVHDLPRVRSRHRNGLVVLE